MTTKELADIIFSTNGEPFTCIFIKKNGQERILKGQLGVKKDLKGFGLSYTPKDYDLISVYDTENEGYRMIPIEGLIKVEFKGNEYYVSETDD